MQWGSSSHWPQRTSGPAQVAQKGQWTLGLRRPPRAHPTAAPASSAGLGLGSLGHHMAPSHRALEATSASLALSVGATSLHGGMDAAASVFPSLRVGPPQELTLHLLLSPHGAPRHLRVLGVSVK